ncbi:MAG: 8-oxoguanine deaminase [Chloroflexi bacterium]|nr:8-oxoguanine deaminase [Chloroflexota bacterium]
MAAPSNRFTTSACYNGAVKTTLIRHAHLVATFDDRRREIRDGAILVRGHLIEQVGATSELPSGADETIDARDHVIIPGLINCHHHLYQTLTRAVPGAQDGTLFQWLVTLYPIWANLTAQAIYISALTGLSELLLSGCTTVADHLYIYPNGARIDDEIRAAQEIGVRFHPTRGSMSLGESQGGLPPDRVTENEEAILRDTRRAIEAYHDPAPYSMCRVGVAPCSPFSVTTDLMRQSAELARAYGVRCHTHLAETADEDQFCLEKFGRRPLEYAEDVGWVGDDVWYAHGVWFDPAEIGRIGRSGSGIAHCPTSNMRLGSGVAPLLNWLSHGVKVGLGVDGSASNDSGHLLAETRQAMLLQRVTHGPAALTARQALELGTRGGAAVLGRTDIGALAPGMAADLAMFDLNQLAYAGAWHDPLAALVFCAPQTASLVMVNGRLVVREQHLTTIELGPVIEQHNRIARAMVDGPR